MPKFSIIVPMHNAYEFGRTCLNSIRNQSFKDYELIIICDKCNDNTEDLARAYTDKVFVTDFGNTGLARSKGLDEATGDWVLWLDHDDHWLHEFVLEQIAEKVDNSMDILQFGFIWKDKGFYGPKKLGNGHVYSNVWSKCVKRSFIGDTRFQNIYYGDDGVFVKDLIAKKPTIVTWEMPIYYYNWMAPGSQTEYETKNGTINDTIKKLQDLKE